MSARDHEELAEELRDELAGWPIGSGYYGTSVGIGEAQEMADALLAPGGVVDRIAGKRAAEKLRAMAAELSDSDQYVEIALGGAAYVQTWLTARADALSARDSATGDTPEGRMRA